MKLAQQLPQQHLQQQQDSPLSVVSQALPNSQDHIPTPTESHYSPGYVRTLCPTPTPDDDKQQTESLTGQELGPQETDLRSLPPELGPQETDILSPLTPPSGSGPA